MEGWTTLAALAACTQRVRLGTLVSDLPLRHPAMLAKQAATVDAISGGRLIVALGAGWNEREYRAFGFPYDRRVSRFAEGLVIIAALLRDGRCTFTGEFYAVDDCVLDPPPSHPGGPPIMLGSTGPRMLSIGLPVVDAWNVWWSGYGNSVAGFAELAAQVATRVPAGRTVDATAAVLVSLPGGGGRLMGSSSYNVPVQEIGVDELAGHVRGLASAGARHLQLVLDPITAESIELIGPVLAELDR